MPTGLPTGTLRSRSSGAGARAPPLRSDGCGAGGLAGFESAAAVGWAIVSFIFGGGDEGP